MNKKILLSIASVSALLGGLASCSLGGDAYFKIDFYSDYEGIHNGLQGEDYLSSDALSASKAVYIGSGYVSQKSSSRVARLSHLNKQSDGTVFDYHSTQQQKQKGHVYTFDGWQGFYETSSGASEKIDLNNIAGDCAVFAHFSVTKEKYSVSIQNVDSSLLFQGQLEYGTRLGDALNEEFGTEEAAKKKLSEVEYALPAKYYMSYEFDGTYKDSDGGSLDVNDLFDLTIEGKKTFKASFGEGNLKKYKVSFFKDASFSETLSVDENEFAEVAYGEALSQTMPNYEEGGYVYVFSGWRGAYGDNSPEAIRGKSFDASHVLFDCSVYPVYEKKIKTLSVTFVNGDGSLNFALKVDYGTQFGEIDLPSNVTSAPANYSFASIWSKNENDEVGAAWISSSTEIVEDITLYPVFAKTKIENAVGGKGDSFDFDYDVERKGYVISSFSPSTTRSDKVLTADDIPLDQVPASFGLVGVSSFKDASNSYREALDSISLPESVKYIAPRAFAYHKNLTSISLPGVVEIDAFGLSCLFSLTSLTLPNTLLKAGSRIFYEDSNLAEVKLEMTKQEASSLDLASDWNSNGASLVAVSYKA